MFRPASLVLMVLASWLVGLTAVPAAADPPVALSYHDRIHAQLILPDLSTLMVGERGPVSGDCSEGARALVLRRAADGSTLWARVVHADAGADPDASALFVGPGSPDPATVFGSRAWDLAYDGATETLTIGGELVQVTETDGLRAERRGFLLGLDIDGNVLAGGPVGPPFDDGPPDEAPTCESICLRLQDREGDLWRPRGIARSHSGEIVVTGDRQLADGSQQAFLARYSAQLELLWDRPLAAGEPGEGRDVVVVPSPQTAGGELIYVTGTLGSGDRNVIVESYDGAGRRLGSISSTGARLDAGEHIAVLAGGPVVTGRFNGMLRFGDLVLDASGCEGRFQATFDHQLQPLELELLGATAPPQALVLPGQRGAAAKAGPASAPQLLSIRVLEGYWAGGGVCQLEDSDDSYFSIAGEPIHPGQSDATFVASFAVDPAAPTITHLSFELSSSFCTALTISLGGGEGNQFFPILSGSLCPMGEPVATVAVPTAVSHALGFGGGGQAAQQGLPLLVKVELSFYGYTLCGQGIFCTTGAKDGSVDELELGSSGASNQ